jgi:large subunit ribosomal protein L25
MTQNQAGIFQRNPHAKFTPASIVLMVEEHTGTMSEIFVLEAQKREITGKRVRQLRAKGVIPAVVYGPKQAPVHIAVEWPILRQTLSKAGATHLVEVRANGEVYTTLIRHVDRHPVKYQEVLHVDFYAVDMTKLIETTVPIVLVNVSTTESRIGGVIALDLPTVVVETLPGNIPSEIKLDVSRLSHVGEYLRVSDLPVLEGVTYITEPHTTIVRVEYLAVEAEEEEEAPAAETVEPEVISRRKEEEFEEE